jgi:mono/diheme cytochrome c family protein
MSAAPSPINAAEIAVAGKNDYQKLCGVCHLPDGNGIPGAFPPLNDRLGRWANTESGRTYLVKILTKGMSGTIVVDGQKFFGVMPAAGMQMKPEPLAGLLNYVLQTFASAVDVQPYTAEEIQKRRNIEVSNVKDIRPEGSI